MRCLRRLGPVTQKTDSDASRGGKRIYVAREFCLEIRGIRPHGREAPDRAKEVRPEQPFKVADEAETVVHSHRGQRVLSENAKTLYEIAGIACASPLAKHP